MIRIVVISSMAAKTCWLILSMTVSEYTSRGIGRKKITLWVIERMLYERS